MLFLFISFSVAWRLRLNAPVTSKDHKTSAATMQAPKNQTNTDHLNSSDESKNILRMMNHAETEAKNTSAMIANCDFFSDMG